jgi:DNA-binding transcriptional LysR family regulator
MPSRYARHLAFGNTACLRHHSQNLLALVAAGVGVTRLPLSARTLRDSGVAFVPLAEDLVDVVLVWRSEARNPALPALREVVREVGRTTDPTAAG